METNANDFTVYNAVNRNGKIETNRPIENKKTKPFQRPPLNRFAMTSGHKTSLYSKMERSKAIKCLDDHSTLPRTTPAPLLRQSGIFLLLTQAFELILGCDNIDNMAMVPNCKIADANMLGRLMSSVHSI
jgi:hypothetical protein